MPVREPVLCLIGAGVNPALLTRDLTQDLLAWDEFRDPTGSRKVTGAIPRGDHDKRSPFFDWMRSQLKTTFQNPIEANFEDLIHILDLVASEGKEIDPTWASWARPYGADVFRLKDLGRKIARQNPSYISDRACMYILRRVKARTSSIGTLSAADLIGQLSSTGWLLRVFSLNYDSLIMSRLGGSAWTGYGAEKPGGAEFLLAPSFPADSHLHIQLHGSINFGAAQIRLDRVTRFNRFSNADEAADTWGTVSGADMAMDRSYLPNVPMITGRRKPDRIIQEPFASYYHYLRQAAFETPNWLVLGYGGGDIHVNGVLMSAMEHWGERLRVFVCNWLDEKQCDPPGFYGMELGHPCADIVFGRTGYASLFDNGERRFHQRRHEADQPPIYRRARLSRWFSNKLNDATLLTVDGKYVEHEKTIAHWFRHLKRKTI